ncbi:unnamed protein product [Rotaria sp. Silwood1]|nr:unnamed protein product [Rotaria sp. Silwood1]
MDRIKYHRTVTLKRKKGETFGFSLHRAIEDGAEFRLVEGLPTLHKIIKVLENGYAHKASLCNDDRLIEINGQDVKSKSYAECVQLIQNTGDTLTIKIIRVPGENTISQFHQTSITATVDSNTEKQSFNINISDFLKSNRCIYSIKVDYNDSSIIQCFETFKPHCQNPESSLHTTFNTIVNKPLDANIFSQILSNQSSTTESLTAYVVDSLKRNHGLNDIIVLLSEALELLAKNDANNKYEMLVDQLTKRMLLVQTLENMSYDSQRFLCNFIRKNDLPIPLSYQFWNSTEKTM